MARPKMTAVAAKSITNYVLGQNAGMKNGEEPKRLVKLEDGRMVHMRVKNPPPNSHEEIHGCVDNDNGLKPGSSSDNGAENVPVTPQVQIGDDGNGEQFKCTACGVSVHITQVVAHPLLLVGVCTVCYEFLFSSPFTKDNPDEHENECRWCGDGGDVVLCDFCPKAFCKACIERNCGADHLHAIESPTGRWPCFVCDNRPLHPAILECKNLERLQQSSAPPQKRRRIRPRHSQAGSLPPQKRKRIRDGPRSWSRCRSIINKTYSADDTIAAIIAREQARLRKENPGKYFTGFEAPDPRRRRRPKYRPAPHHDSNSEHDHTSNGGAVLPFSDVARDM